MDTRNSDLDAAEGIVKGVVLGVLAYGFAALVIALAWGQWGPK